MNAAGLVQLALVAVVVVVLLILVQMAGGGQRVVGDLVAQAKPPPQAAASAGGSFAGVGASGAAMSRLNSATNASINRSMATIDHKH